MRAINVLLAIVVSLVIGLGVFELGLRLLGKGPAPQVLEFDSHLGWKKKPDLDVKRSGPEYSVHLVTNQYGLADDPMTTPAKPAGTYRVIALGDSFTQGFTVDRKDLFVDVLERWWKEEGRKVEILNAGCEAYSTDQEVAWLLEHGKEFQPDAVAIFTYENDLYWCGSPTYEARDTQKPLFRADGSLPSSTLVDVGPKPWYERCAIGLLLKPFLADTSAVRKYYFTPDGGSGMTAKEFAPLLTTQPDFLAPSLDGAKGALTALKKKCDELGAKLVLVTIPSHSAIDADYAVKTFATARLPGLPPSAWSADKPVDTFIGLASGLGITSIDPRGFFREHAKQGQKLYFDIDWHLSPDGNRIFAHFLHDELDRLAFFPAAFASTKTVAAPPDHVEATGVPTFVYVFAVLWVALTLLFISTYPDEKKALAPLKIGGLLAMVFTIAIGGNKLIQLLPAQYARPVFILFVLVLLGFIIYKLGRRIGTVTELFKSFTLRGHWYLMPLIVVLLSIGSLLVVAASSPFVAPFIYTLF